MQAIWASRIVLAPSPQVSCRPNDGDKEADGESATNSCRHCLRTHRLSFVEPNLVAASSQGSFSSAHTLRCAALAASLQRRRAEQAFWRPLLRTVQREKRRLACPSSHYAEACRTVRGMAGRRKSGRDASTDGGPVLAVACSVRSSHEDRSNHISCARVVH